nr:hybrid sensor histidine kinase/response regulator [Thiospirillum jenense]
MAASAAAVAKLAEVRLLLVDDNRANRTVITAMLRKLGYQDVVAVGGGHSALQHLAQQDVDLVLTDCQMPDMNGMELVKRIRSADSEVRQHEVPVIALTGLTDSSAQNLCMQAGINGYLVKPVNLVDLAAMLTKHLGDRATSQLILEPPTPPVPAATNVPTPAATLTPAPLGDDLSPLFRSRELLERVGQDPDIASAVVGQFLSDVPMRIVELHTSLSIGDVERVKFLAHSIKGLAGTIAAPGLQNLAARLETGTQDIASDLILAGELDAEYRRLARVLRHSLQQWTKQRTD